MAQPNYQFEKRQKDLAKKKKREEKLQRKSAAKGSAADDNNGQPAQESAETPAEAPALQEDPPAP